MLVEPWGYETAEARNLLLMLMVLFENVHVFNVRSETRSAFRIPLSANWLLGGAVFASQGVHIVSMSIPGWSGVLEVEPVAVTTWAILLGLTLTKFLVVEAYKHARGRKLAERSYRRAANGGPDLREQPAGDGSSAAREAEEQRRHG